MRQTLVVDGAREPRTYRASSCARAARAAALGDAVAAIFAGRALDAGLTEAHFAEPREAGRALLTRSTGAGQNSSVEHQAAQVDAGVGNSRAACVHRPWSDTAVAARPFAFLMLIVVVVLVVIVSVRRAMTRTPTVETVGLMVSMPVMAAVPMAPGALARVVLSTVRLAPPLVFGTLLAGVAAAGLLTAAAIGPRVGLRSPLSRCAGELRDSARGERTQRRDGNEGESPRNRANRGLHWKTPLANLNGPPCALPVPVSRRHKHSCLGVKVGQYG